MITLAIYSIFGFLSSEFWMWVFKSKEDYNRDPVLRMTVSAFIGCFLALSLIFI